MNRIPTNEEIDHALRRNLACAELTEGVSRRVRKAVEAQFGLDLSARKAFMKQRVKELLLEMQEQLSQPLSRKPVVAKKSQKRGAKEVDRKQNKGKRRKTDEVKRSRASGRAGKRRKGKAVSEEFEGTETVFEAEETLSIPSGHVTRVQVAPSNPAFKKQLLQADYQLFMKAYGEVIVTSRIITLRKPVWGQSFLMRTLSYMPRKGKSNGKRRRSRFRWDKFLEARVAACSVNNDEGSVPEGTAQATEDSVVCQSEMEVQVPDQTEPMNVEDIGKPEDLSGVEDKDGMDGTEASADEGALLYARPIPKKLVYILYYGEGMCLSKNLTVENLECVWCEHRCKKLLSLLHHLNCCHPRCEYEIEGSSDGPIVHVRATDTWKKEEQKVYLADRKLAEAEAHLAGLLDNPPRGTDQRSLRASTEVTNATTTVDDLTKAIRESKGFIMPIHAKLLPISYFAGQTTDKSGNRKRRRVEHRVYYRSNTFLPAPKDYSEDSDDEVELEWLHSSSDKLLGEFLDLNAAEKTFMKMWNRFMWHTKEQLATSGRPLTDGMFPEYAKLFVLQHRESIRACRLDHNLKLHLGNLYDFNLITATQVKDLLEIAEG